MRSMSIRMGYVLVDGYSRYRWYYKTILDKLNVDINIFRVGKYKSAVEDYTRDRHVARGSRGEPGLSERAVERPTRRRVDGARKLPCGRHGQLHQHAAAGGRGGEGRRRADCAEGPPGHRHQVPGRR